MEDEISATRPFTHMQWYLAHARNTVHYAAFSPYAMSKSDFRKFVGEFVSRAPQLMLGENLDDDCHHPIADARLDDLCEYQNHEVLDVKLTDWLQPRPNTYAGTNKPAFRAWCVSSKKPDARGMQSFIHMQSSHALMEGSDLSYILREKPVANHAKPTVDVELNFRSRISMALLAPILAITHLVMSKFEKKRVGDFRFHSLAANSRSLARCARRMKISRRALLFALVLFAVIRGEGPVKRQLFGYSTLPHTKIRLEDDAYLNLRMQLLPFRGPKNFEAFAQALHEALGKQNESEIFTQFLYNRILAIQRRVHQLIPWLYKGSFFGFAPYDIVLSLLPPVRPAKAFSAISDTPVFGGSFTGTVANCIYLAGRRETTLNFWVNEPLLSNMPTLSSLMDECGIEYVEWMKPSAIPTNVGLPAAKV